MKDFTLPPTFNKGSTPALTSSKDQKPTPWAPPGIDPELFLPADWEGSRRGTIGIDDITRARLEYIARIWEQLEGVTPSHELLIRHVVGTYLNLAVIATQVGKKGASPAMKAGKAVVAFDLWELKGHQEAKTVPWDRPASLPTGRTMEARHGRELMHWEDLIEWGHRRPPRSKPLTKEEEKAKDEELSRRLDELDQDLHRNAWKNAIRDRRMAMGRAKAIATKKAKKEARIAAARERQGREKDRMPGAMAEAMEAARDKQGESATA